MIPSTRIPARKYKVYTEKSLDKIPQLQSLPRVDLTALKAVATVLPFRVNEYVLERLIDWNEVPHDPIYQLTIPQRGMLKPDDFERMYRLVRNKAPEDVVRQAARRIQLQMNPHPSGQLELNRPRFNGGVVEGMQHKYGDTLLFFPSQGQTCHAYCTYCFRWAQFVGMDELKFASKEADALVAYLKVHPEVRSVLFTGGDPMVMKTSVLRRYVEPLLTPELEHLESIRIGTKAPAYWPYRFVTDSDADDVLRLFEDVERAGKQLAVMAHYSHPQELRTEEAEVALKRIQRTGAVVRCQAPLIRRVNDDAGVWAEMWSKQYRLGAIPYYMFIERNTGPKNYFEVPLARAYQIFREAYASITGLARTVRGPSMSAAPGKVKVCGITEVRGEKVFVLEFLRGRNPGWVGKPFFAEFDDQATWLDQLVPAFGDDRFFFEREPGGPSTIREFIEERASIAEF